MSVLVIGLTGGLGAGKTTVAKMFAHHGARRIDTDRLARDLVRLGTPGSRAIRRAFGADVFRANGSLDRRRLAQHVFGHRHRVRRLNRIVHPRVVRVLRHTLQRARRGRYTTVVVEIPLLIEVGLQSMVDVVVVVTAPQRVRMLRVQRTTGWTPAEIRQRVRAQSSTATKLEYADYVIRNGGAKAQTRRQVKQLWQMLKR